LLGLGLLCGDPEFAELYPSILWFAEFEGFSDLQDLILVQPLIHVFLHLKVLKFVLTRIILGISHLNKYNKL
jgi:nucleoside permease NupC